MDYLLIVLTHGGGATLQRTLQSFEEHVYPQPADAVLVEDGSPHLLPVEWWTGRRVHTGGRRGFCEAVAAGWAEARATTLPFVFWLEHDFLIRRDIDLRDVAAILTKHTHLAQMRFMRQPVNTEEVARGGVLGSRPHERVEDFLTGAEWVEHDLYWTTNPSLFPAHVARAFSWPEGPGCEGKMAAPLRAAGYSFAAWGDGATAWVEHVGVLRSGVGY